MGSRIAVANILKQEGHRPSIKVENVPLRSVRQEKGPNSDIGFYMTSSDCILADNGKVCHKRFRAMSKSRQAATMLAQLLNDQAAIKDYEKAEIIGQEQNQPFTRVGDTVFVLDETFSTSQAIDTHSWNLFISTEFHFPSAFSNHGLTSTQHLQISCPNLKFGETLFMENGTPCFDQIDIVSGVCIFNGGILIKSISSPQRGKLDAEYLRHAKPTFHEMDYIARSSSAIADVATMAISRNREQRSGSRVSISLDIPSWHYYGLPVANFAQGLCTATEALDWMDSVDQRHDQIGRVFMESVQHEVGKRGIHDHSGYQIQTSSRTNSVAFSIRKALRNGEVPSMVNVLQSLNDEEDGNWRDFYSCIPLKEMPQDIEALGHLYYVFEVAKPALHKIRDQQPSTIKEEEKMKSRNRRLIINIDDPAERRIYSRAQEVLRKLRASSNKADSTLVEVYICRRVVVNGNQTRARLYHHDPMPEAPVHFTGRETDPVQPIMPLDVVRQLYGSYCAQNLQRWFAAVGL